MIDQKFYDILLDKKFASILLLSHTPLDGDALGASLAFDLVLKHLGKTALIVNDKAAPHTYEFLPHTDRVKMFENIDKSQKFDLAIVIDTARYNMLGDSMKLLLNSKKVINLDHHSDTPEIGEIQFLYPNVSATCELVYTIARYVGYPFNELFDTYIYTGLLTDTKSFMQLNTTPNSLRIASEIVERGFIPYRLVEKIYENKTASDIQLTGEILKTIKTGDDSRVVHLTYLHSMSEDTGGSLENLDAIIDHARSVNTAEVAVFFKEINAGFFKISFRSRGRVDVKTFVERFQGGGHCAAAGCSLSGQIEDIKSTVLSNLYEYLKTFYPNV